MPFQNTIFYKKSLRIAAERNNSEIISIIISQRECNIENMDFSICSSLTKVILPKSLEEMNESIFLDCHSLIEVTMPPLITAIKNNSFKVRKSLKTIIIPSLVVIIEDYAFYECESLTKISFESFNALKSIGNYFLISSQSNKFLVHKIILLLNLIYQLTMNC